MALLKCKVCKKRIALDAESCPKCGTNTPFDLVDCTNKKCGAKTPKGAKKCPACSKEQVTFLQLIQGFLVLAVIVFIALQVFSGEKDKVSETFASNADKKLPEIRQLSSAIRAAVYQDFYNQNENAFSSVGSEKAVACLSEYVHDKSADFSLKDMGQWCLDAVKQNRNFTQYVNYEKFESFFSGWDGSYRPLVKLTKAAMNNPDSFEHVSTTYRIAKRVDGAVGFVRMQYRGTNIYNAIVTNSVLVQVDPATGEIKKLVEEN